MRMTDPLSLFFDEEPVAVAPPPLVKVAAPAVQTHRCWICQKRLAVGTEDCPHWCQRCADEQERIAFDMQKRGGTR